MKDIYSTHDVARICSVTPMTVIRWIEDGRLPAFKTAGGHRRVHRGDLEVFCRERGISSDPLQAGRRRVLIICVDAEERDRLAAAARGAGAEVVVEVASDALEGGRMLALSRPHLLILDERAAGAAVGEMCLRLRDDAQLGSTELMVFGPSPSAELARDLRRRGVLECIARPLDAGAVRAAVRGALGLRDENANRRLRVLLVDDDPLFCRAIKRELARRGAEVIVADTGYDALLLVGSVRPDVMLLDYHLPDLNGVEVARRVRGRPETADVAVVAISAHADDKAEAALLAAGALALLRKPFTAEQVYALLPDREPVLASA